MRYTRADENLQHAQVIRTGQVSEVDAPHVDAVRDLVEIGRLPCRSIGGGAAHRSVRGRRRSGRRHSDAPRPSARQRAQNSVVSSGGSRLRAAKVTTSCSGVRVFPDGRRCVAFGAGLIAAVSTPSCSTEILSRKIRGKVERCHCVGARPASHSDNASRVAAFFNCSATWPSIPIPGIRHRSRRRDRRFRRRIRSTRSAGPAERSRAPEALRPSRGGPRRHPERSPTRPVSSVRTAPARRDGIPGRSGVRTGVMRKRRCR